MLFTNVQQNSLGQYIIIAKKVKSFVTDSFYAYISHRLEKQQYAQVCKQQQIASGTKVLLVIYKVNSGADDNETYCTCVSHHYL